MQQPSKPNETSHRSVYTLLGSLLVCLVSGPLAVLTTFLAPLLVGQPLFLIGAAAVEEFAKPLAVIMLIERRSKIIVSSTQIIFLALVGAAVFSIIENLLYIHVYFPSHTPALTHTRWLVCTPLHLGTTMIFSLGIRRLWLKIRTDGLFEPEPFLPYYIIAVAVHSAYNVAAVILPGSH